MNEMNLSECILKSNKRIINLLSNHNFNETNVSILVQLHELILQYRALSKTKYTNTPIEKTIARLIFVNYGYLCSNNISILLH
jgi:hypothetical protein